MKKQKLRNDVMKNILRVRERVGLEKGGRANPFLNFRFIFINFEKIKFKFIKY